MGYLPPLCPVCAAAGMLATGLRAVRLGLAPRLAARLGQHAGRGPHVQLGRVQQRIALAVQQARPRHAEAFGFRVLGRDLHRFAFRELLLCPGVALGQLLDPARLLRRVVLRLRLLAPDLLGAPRVAGLGRGLFAHSVPVLSGGLRPGGALLRCACGFLLRLLSGQTLDQVLGPMRLWRLLTFCARALGVAPAGPESVALLVRDGLGLGRPQRL